ncbi:MAG: hypothetical protein AAGI44_19210, partial [Pseudomonadota bacterium]
MDHRGIEQHGNGIRITVQYKGKRYRRFLNKPWSVKRNKAEAQRIRNDLKFRLKNGIPLRDEGDEDNPTFIEMCKMYLKAFQGKPSTRGSYAQLLETYWAPHLEDVCMLQMTYSQVLKADLENNWSGPKTRRNAVGALRGVFDLAISTLDGFNVNFAAKLPSSKVE